MLSHGSYLNKGVVYYKEDNNAEQNKEVTSNLIGQKAAQEGRQVQPDAAEIPPDG